ncbi:hypothetical protein Glove_225g42 [Diversispora epigaea]|uniref:Uncharacterized protein n=1 Tax=Diversispora epigaea TaxID=1348612 RepID=A0A397IHR4_9GLOM|nr:hypothetical protein Glove_225g42 [Diversispora epigaea]
MDATENSNMSLVADFLDKISSIILNKDESFAKNTNLNISDISEDDQEDQKDQENQEGENVNEIEKFFISKDNNDKVYRDDISDSDNFIECTEKNQPTTRRSWVLNSSTNVGDELAKYVKMIPEAHKYLNLAYWNILDLTEDI